MLWESSANSLQPHVAVPLRGILQGSCCEQLPFLRPHALDSGQRSDARTNTTEMISLFMTLVVDFGTS
jgi:hypothetical protein